MSVAAPTSAGDPHGAPPGRGAAGSDATSSTRRLAGVEPIGREDELADIVARVGAGRRLVTIVGPGGIGKTTLARAACAAVDGGTPEGRLVELSRVDRSDAVTGAIAADLGFTAFEVVLGSPELNGGVVVVDNCEHVADAAAGAVDAMLRACPSLVILATSRSPLAWTTNRSSRWHHWPCRPRGWSTPRAGRCSCSASGPATPASPSTTTTSTWSARSAVDSTACRCRSSSPRRVCDR